MIRNILLIACNMYLILLFIRVIFSFWASMSSDIPDSIYAVMEVIHNITEPLLFPIRQVFGRLFPNLMLDFSPIILYLIFNYILIPFIEHTVRF